jgi:LysM repeat protein
VALAWAILLSMTAAGPIGSPRPAQATTRTASTTSNTTTIQATLTSSVTTTRTTTPTTHLTGADARAGSGSYVVQRGDTLSGIAAALGTAGGWPALYAANRRAIGNDPGLIRPGTVLALPGQATPHEYRVAAGDTLSGIAAAFAIRGGWPALYAANQRVIGPDPDAIRAGIVLAIPHPTSATSTAPQPAPPAPASQPAPPAAHPAPTPTKAPRSAQPTAGGLPRWLEIVLVAAGLLIAIAFLTEPVLALARRRRAARPAAAAAADDAHIVLADYERLVVTHSRQDGTVYVLRPPDADPQAILLAARLVLAQDRYEELAGHLGVPAHWPRE